MELSLGQGLVLYTLIVIVCTVGVVEAIHTVRKTRRMMRNIERYEVD